MVRSASRSGPSPARHARANTVRLTASSCRTPPHVKLRSQEPTVDGARTSSNNSDVAPARSTSTSSMQSPPTSAAPTTVAALAPPLAPAAPATPTSSSTSPATPSRWANTPPRPARHGATDARRQTSTTRARDSAMISPVRCPPLLGSRGPITPAFSQSGGHLPFNHPHQHPPPRWIRAHGRSPGVRPEHP